MWEACITLGSSLIAVGLVGMVLSHALVSHWKFGSLANIVWKGGG